MEENGSNFLDLDTASNDNIEMDIVITDLNEGEIYCHIENTALDVLDQYAVESGEESPSAEEPESKLADGVQKIESYVNSFNQMRHGLMIRDAIVMISGTCLAFTPQIQRFCSVFISLFPIVLSVWTRSPTKTQSVFMQIERILLLFLALFISSSYTYLILLISPHSPAGVLVFQFFYILLFFYKGLKHPQFLIFAAFVIIFQASLMQSAYSIFNFESEYQSNQHRWDQVFKMTEYLFLAISIPVGLHLFAAFLIFPFLSSTGWKKSYKSSYLKGAQLLGDIQHLINEDWIAAYETIGVGTASSSRNNNATNLNRRRSPDVSFETTENDENENEINREKERNELIESICKGADVIRNHRKAMTSGLHDLFCETRWFFNGSGATMLHAYRRNRLILRGVCCAGTDTKYCSENIWERFPVQLRLLEQRKLKENLDKLLNAIIAMLNKLGNDPPYNLFDPNLVQECNVCFDRVNKQILKWVKLSDVKDMIYKKQSFLTDFLCGIDEIVRVLNSIKDNNDKRYGKNVIENFFDIESEEKSYTNFNPLKQKRTLKNMFVDWPITLRIYRIFDFLEKEETRMFSKPAYESFGKIKLNWYQTMYKDLARLMSSAELKTSFKVAIVSVVINSLGYLPSTHQYFTVFSASAATSTVQSCFRTLHLGLVLNRAMYRVGGILAGYIFGCACWQFVVYWGYDSSFIENAWISCFFGFILVFNLLNCKYNHPQHSYGAYSFYKEFFVVTLQQLIEPKGNSIWYNGGFTTLQVLLGAILASLSAFAFWPVSGKSELRKLLAETFHSMRLQYEYSILYRHCKTSEFAKKQKLSRSLEKSENYIANLLSVKAQTLLKAADWEPFQLNYDLPLSSYQKLLEETRVIWKCMWKHFHIRGKTGVFAHYTPPSMELMRVTLRHRRLIVNGLDGIYHAFQNSEPCPALFPIIATPAYKYDIKEFLDGMAREQEIKAIFENCKDLKMIFSMCTLYGNQIEMSQAFQELYILVDKCFGQVTFASELRAAEYRHMMPKIIPMDEYSK